MKAKVHICSGSDCKIGMIRLYVHCFSILSIINELSLLVKIFSLISNYEACKLTLVSESPSHISSRVIIVLQARLRPSVMTVPSMHRCM